MKHISVYDQMTWSEKEVANFLKETGIFWSFEKPIYIWDENDRPRVWTPDFCLVSFGIYVEVCGSEDFDYNYRKKTYRNNGYDVIFLHLYKDPRLWKRHFINFLKMIMNNRSKNFEYIFKLIN